MSELAMLSGQVTSLDERWSVVPGDTFMTWQCAERHLSRSRPEHDVCLVCSEVQAAYRAGRRAALKDIRRYAKQGIRASSEVDPV